MKENLEIIEEDNNELLLINNYLDSLRLTLDEHYNKYNYYDGFNIKLYRKEQERVRKLMFKLYSDFLIKYNKKHNTQYTGLHYYSDRIGGEDGCEYNNLIKNK